MLSSQNVFSTRVFYFCTRGHIIFQLHTRCSVEQRPNRTVRPGRALGLDSWNKTVAYTYAVYRIINVRRSIKITKLVGDAVKGGTSANILYPWRGMHVLFLLTGAQKAQPWGIADHFRLGGGLSPGTNVASPASFHSQGFRIHVLLVPLTNNDRRISPRSNCPGPTGLYSINT